MRVEPSRPSEREAILNIARAVGVFSAEEVLTVDELFDGYVRDAVKSGYNFFSCHDGERLIGFACWGPTALSKGACDLYWICAHPEARGLGAGAALFQAVEAEAQRLGRWLVMIWTSNRPDYEPARRFYARMGCALAVQITDFYDRGEDLCVFMRRLSPLVG
jgi:GNAT superfamily N-acetyltransferase